MSEQGKPCLQEVFDAVNEGVASSMTSRIGEMTVESLMLEDVIPTSSMVCDAEGCNTTGLLLHEKDNDNADHIDKTCLKANFANLPTSPDKYGCSAAQYSYALAKLGIKMTPDEVDVMSGRTPKEFFEYGKNDESLKVGLLNKGIRVESVYSPDTDMYEDYLGLELQVGYKEYCRRTIELFGDEDGREWLSKNMSMEQFAQTLVQHVEKMQRITDAAAHSRGEHVISREPITVELLQEKLDGHVVLLDILHEQKYATHAVVLEAIKPVNGKIFVKYFNPGSKMSNIKTQIVDSLESFIDLDTDIRLLSLSAK